MFSLVHQLPRRITPEMAREFVNDAPQRSMLWNGDNNATVFSFDCVKHLGQDRLIVQQHVKSADDIEMITKRNTAGVHLIQLRVGDAPLCEMQATGINFAAMEFDIRKR